MAPVELPNRVADPSPPTRPGRTVGWVALRLAQVCFLAAGLPCVLYRSTWVWTRSHPRVAELMLAFAMMLGYGAAACAAAVVWLLIVRKSVDGERGRREAMTACEWTVAAGVIAVAGLLALTAMSAAGW